MPTRLRSHGRVPAQGRHPRAQDYASQRRWLAVKARRERAQLEAAIARFADRTLRLSDLGELDDREFDLLLGLLDAALAAPRTPDGSRTTRTTDGRLHVVLQPPADGANCRLRTPRGLLHAPDYHLEVREALPARGGSGRPQRTEGVAQLREVAR